MAYRGSRGRLLAGARAKVCRILPLHSARGKAGMEAPSEVSRARAASHKARLSHSEPSVSGHHDSAGL